MKTYGDTKIHLTFHNTMVCKVNLNKVDIFLLHRIDYSCKLFLLMYTFIIGAYCCFSVKIQNRERATVFTYLGQGSTLA